MEVVLGGKPDESKVGDVIELDGSKANISSKTRVEEATYTIDATTSPKQIDIRPKEGDDDRVIKGIFKLENGKLILCLARPGSDRPTKFESNEGDLVIYAVAEPVE